MPGWEEQSTGVCVLAAFLYGSWKSTNSFITLAALKTKLCPLCFYCWSLLCWHALRALIAQDVENKMRDQLPVSECQLARKRRRRAPGCPSFCFCFTQKLNARCCGNSQGDGWDKLSILQKRNVLCFHAKCITRVWLFFSRGLVLPLLFQRWFWKAKQSDWILSGWMLHKRFVIFGN